MGCHPTRCNEFEESGDAEGYLKSMENLATHNRDKIVAIGEMGLDYDRVNFCPKDIQKQYFEMQLSLCSTLKLPMFLHCRNASEDFVNILRKHKDTLTEGVVHSFDGNPEEANSILQLGLFIGINGWFVIILLLNLYLKCKFVFNFIYLVTIYKLILSEFRLMNNLQLAQDTRQSFRSHDHSFG